MSTTVLLLSLLIASLLALILLRNRLSAKSLGKSVVICGPVGSGKTTLFLKLTGKFNGPNEILHSVESNTAILPESNVLLIDQAVKKRQLHSNPLPHFHYQTLAGIVFLSDDVEHLAVAIAIAILKDVPLCLFRASTSPLPSLLRHLAALQKTPPTDESFTHPINRLLFENVDGDLADYEPTVKKFFTKRVKIVKNEIEVKNWIMRNCQ